MVSIGLIQKGLQRSPCFEVGQRPASLWQPESWGRCGAGTLTNLWVPDVDETFRTNSRSSVWKTVRWESRNPSVEDIHLAHPARLANWRAAKREQYLGQTAMDPCFWPRGPPMLIYFLWEMSRLWLVNILKCKNCVYVSKSLSTDGAVVSPRCVSGGISPVEPLRGDTTGKHNGKTQWQPLGEKNVM